MADKIFADGIRFDKPRDGAPEFVRGRISIQADQAIPFIEKYKNEKGWVNLDLKKSVSGVLYLELNTFSKKVAGEPVNNEEITSQDIPF